MDPLPDRLAALVNGRPWANRRRLLESDPALYSTDADSILADWIEQIYPAADGADVLQEYRDLLAVCRADGVTATMDALAEGIAQQATSLLNSDVPEDVEDGMLALVDAAATVSPGSPRRTYWCMRFSSVCFGQYRSTGDLEALDSGILALERTEQMALPGADELPTLLNNLADGLLLRHEATGTEADLAAALAACRRGARPDRNDKTQWALLVNTSQALRALAGRGQPELLDEAVATAELAAARNRDDDLAPAVLAELGSARLQLYRDRGDPADLNAGLEVIAESVRRMPPDYPDRWVRHSEIGLALLDRYDRTADVDDVDAAITAFGLAAAACPPDTPHRAGISTDLGLAIAERWERTRAPEDLDAAVTAFEEAVLLSSPAMPAWSSMLGNLGGGLLDRYRQRADADDLDRALDCFTRAIRDGGRAGWREKAADQHNLSSALLEQHARDGDARDLAKAVAALRAAVDQTPGTSPLLAGWLGALATALARRHETSSDESDRRAASEAFRRACRLAARADTATMLRTGMRWGQWSSRTGHWDEAAGAFEAALTAMERLVRTQGVRLYKETWLRDGAQIGPGGGLAAYRAGDLPGAVTGLERARAVLLREALDRTPVDLHRLAASAHGELARRFTTLTEELWRQEAAGPNLAARSAVGDDGTSV